MMLFLTIAFAVQSQNISLSGEALPLKQLFKHIKLQTGYLVAFDEESIKGLADVKLPKGTYTLTNMLDKSLKPGGLTYTIRSKTIFIAKDAVKAPPGQPKNNKTEVEGRKINVRGTVVDENNIPLQGITVTIKGTDRGAATNSIGEFFFIAVELEAIIEFQGIGYPKQEQPVRSEMHMILARQISNLDEVQVIAYGSTTRRLNTGSVTTVSAKDLEKQPVSNILGALSGRVPGLVVTQSSGNPGASFNLQIRGRNSITQGSTPLILINGVPFAPGNSDINTLNSSISNLTYGGGLSPFFSINPSDIESIEILKDADATAIYGSRAANGVILITTKNGEIGSTKVTANFSKGISIVPQGMGLMNTGQYLEMRKEAFRNTNTIPDENNAPDLTVWDQNRFTDLRKELIGDNGHTVNAQLSVSGGTSRTQFLLSGGYFQETSVLPGHLPNGRGSVNANINHVSSNGKFQISFNGNYISTQNKAHSFNIVYYTFLPPNIPSFFDDSENLKWEENGVEFDNPYSFLLKTYKANTGNLLSNLNFSYKIFPGLTIKSTLGYNQLIGKEISLNPRNSMSPVVTSAISSSRFGNSTRNAWDIEPQIEYKKAVGKGNINVLLGGTFQQAETATNTIRLSGFSSDDLLESMSAAGNIDYISTTDAMYRYQAIFGRINYNLQNRYLLNITGRRDGSSRFGPNQRFANFGAIGAAWIFTEEHLIKNNFPILSYGKLRSSLGVTGNDQIGDYQYLDAWSAKSDLSYQGENTLSPFNLFNSNYGWEKNKKIEAALDLGFWKDKILLSINYYQNRSSNQLILYKLPYQTGFGTITDNFPALVENKGWELSLNSQLIKKKKFVWSNSFNITIPENILLDFPNLEASSYAKKLVIGQSLNSLYNYHSSGVDPETGLFHLLDVNNDGILSEKDYVINGTLDPKYYGGFKNTFEFSGIQFDFLFDFKKQLGRNFLNSLYQGGISPVPGAMINQPTNVLRRWQRVGDQVEYEKFQSTANSNRANVALSDAVYSDQSFLRLRSVSLSYTLPLKLLSFIKAKNVNIYGQGQNLWMWNKDIGYDPEVQGLYYMPLLKTFVVGIQVTF